MNPPLYSGVKLAVNWVDSSRWNLSKATKDANISRQGFGLRILGCARYFFFSSRKEDPSIANIRLHYWCVWRKILPKKTVTNEEGKRALLPRQCTVSQVDRNDGKTTWIALRIASAPTEFSICGPQQLLAVCRPQKNTPGKEIWLQWRSDNRNWGVFGRPS